MKKEYTIECKLSVGDEIFINGEMVKLTQEFIDGNPDIFMPINKTWYVKCLKWSGNLYEAGVIYPVHNGVIISRNGDANKYNAVLNSVWKNFEDSNKHDYTMQEMFGRKVKSYPETAITKIETSVLTSLETSVPEYVMIKNDVEQGTGRWAAKEPGKIYKVLKFDCWPGDTEKAYFVSKDTCIDPRDCVQSNKADFDMQELIENCKLKYKVGDAVRKPGGTTISKIKSMDFAHRPDIFSIWVKGEECNVKLYSKTNGWAKVEKPLCTTFDGKDLYEGDKFFWVSDCFDISHYDVNDITLQLVDKNKKFSTLELAQDWAITNKPKDLADYENMLLLDDGEVDADFNANVWEIYYWLKNNEPKLYWTKVLQLIANDLNKGWKPYWNDSIECKYKVQWCETKFECGSNCVYNDGTIYFEFTDSVNTVIKLMGDKLNIIYGV